jgi:sialate O-acetylesterase
MKSAMLQQPKVNITRVGLCMVALLVILFASQAAWAKAIPAKLFTDNMVLQRDSVVPIWGTADAGEEVTVGFAGQTKKTTAGPDGKWMVRLDPLPVNTQPAELTVKGSDQVTLKNILVGDVWLCGGQSNMGLTLAECFNAKEEIAKANHPLLRIVKTGAGASPRPKDQIARGPWQVCTPESAAGFSGVAYFFGAKLVNDLEGKVPIGLIEFDIGSTGIEGWTPLAGFRSSAYPQMQAIYREVASWDPTTEIGKKAHAEAFEKIRAWLPLARAAVNEGRPVPAEPLVPAPPLFRNGPTVLYNFTIHPLVPVAFTGFIWYQGEANPGEGRSYEQKMRAFISGLREVWGRGDFPFYYVQLANEGKPVERPDEEENFRYVPVREAQRRVMDLPNTGMACAIDAGEEANGHPRNKIDVGQRLALWALAKNYGKPVTFTGPLYRGISIKGHQVVVHFDHVGKGLMIGDKDGLNPVVEITDAALKHFSIAGADGVWHWADAKIVGDTVVVSSPKVPAPTKVRYADSLNPKGAKLYNRDGLPASPFRSDDW